MKNILIVLALAWLVVHEAYAGGQNDKTDTGNNQLILEIRAKAPYGPLNLLIGEEINPEEKIFGSTEFKILDRKLDYGFNGVYVWNRVEPKTPNETREWWVKSGPYEEAIIAGLPEIGEIVSGNKLLTK